MKNPTVWTLVENGLIGTEKQCIGVAEALGVTPVLKRFTLKKPWKYLSPYISLGIMYGYQGDALTPPFPDVVIASGRKAVAPAHWIKKQSPKTIIVCLQDPRWNHNKFDLIATPYHDPASGDNVIKTYGAANSITPARLTAAAQKWAPTFAHLGSPRVAVLIGGNSRAHKMTPQITKTLAEQLKALAGQGAGLMITASRRTGPENQKILQDTLNGTSAYLWDGTGDNPYEGFLALADYILVTEDSVSMTSEAATTGKPVYTIPLEGGKTRLNAFHAKLQSDGIIRPFTGTLEQWSPPKIDDASKIADAIKSLL